MFINKKMGVPFYFKKIFTNYPEILQNEYKNQGSCLFLDFNGIIHQSYYKIKNKEINEDSIFSEIKRYLLFLQDKFNPNLIYIAIDGVAPLSKIKQQRQRRFKTVFYQNEKNKIFEKYNNDISNWNSNCITPGTIFMTNLNKFLKTIDMGNLIISDSDEKGEGEHKMFNYIKNNKWIENIIIHGLDADLIFLSLLSNINNIVIYRDNNSKESYLNIDILKSHIVYDLKKKIIFNIENDCNIIKDYILICFLLGNDFVPKITSLDIISNNGLNLIEETYLNILNKQQKFLIDNNNNINYDFLKNLIKDLSSNEVNNLNNANNRYKKKKFFNNTNKTDCELEITKLEFYPLFNKTYLDYNNIFDWKNEYYNHYFKNITDKNEIIEQYLIGIQWILDYYLNGKSDNNWFYPYLNSPLLDDIYNYLNNNNKFPIYIEKYKIEITSQIQLLIVLPKSSHYLLPKNLQNVYNTKLKYLYPTEFYIDTHMNTYLHQCIPFIPNFNIKYINNYIVHQNKTYL